MLDKARMTMKIALAALAVVASNAHADWNPGDAHKMHFPQLPDPTGFDVHFTVGSSLADDWKCSESGPVNEIHFWFSARSDWLDLTQPLDGQIFNMLISICPDNPAGTGGVPYSFPGIPVWQRQYSVGQVTIREYGAGQQSWYSPSPPVVIPNDHHTIYQCNITGIDEPFYQKKGTIYWLEIHFSALQPLGWKTADRGQYPPPYAGLTYQDAAVDFTGGGLPSPLQYPAGPFEGQSMDLAFVIGGEDLTWNHKMHFPQYPDPAGADVLFTGPPRVVADDWMCSWSGPVSDIHFWFSAFNDWLDLSVPLQQQIFNIHVSIHSDIPVGPNTPYSRPGPLLWERDYPVDAATITRCYTEGQSWYDPAGAYIPQNHYDLYRCDIEDIVDPFMQQAGQIYWLDVWMMSENPLGWKTADLDRYPPPLTGTHYQDDGVWGDNPNPIWQELRWPVGVPHGGESIDLAFVITRPGPTGVDQTVPESYLLEQNYPNPFNPTTTIRYALPARSTVELAVFSVDGKLVRVLESGTKPMGSFATSWDGRDSSGHAVASGVYFYRLKAGSFTEIKKMVLLK